MKNNFLTKIKNYLPYGALILIIVLPWFLKSGYLFLTDLSWGPNMPLPHWTSGGFYLMLIIKIFSFVIPASFLEKLFIAFILGVVLWGGRKIASNFSQNKTILFLGSAFALFNPFVYDRLMYGQAGFILAFGFFLAAIGYFLNYYFQPDRIKNLLLASIWAGLAILLSAHFLFFLGLFCAFFWIFLFWDQRGSRGNWLALGKRLGLSILLIGLINLNFILGIFLSESNLLHFAQESVTEADLWAFKTAGGAKLRVIENVFLMSGFWGAEQFRYEPLQNIKGNWGRSFYFLLPLVLLGLVVNLRNKGKRGLTIGLILFYIVAFILALGIALPITSKITLWLFNNLPFYKGLREPQKWVAVMVAVYEVLLVCGLIQLLKKDIVMKNKGLLTVLLTFIILLQAPLMVWGGAGQVKPINYPADWSEVDELIVQDTGCQSKILFLPWHLYMSFNWIGSIVANPAPSFFKCPVIYGKNMEFGGIFGHSADLDEREVEKWALNVGRTNLLEENKLNIGYIILAKEVDWQNYLWIKNHPNVEFVKETDNLRVYKTKKYEGK